MVLEVRSSVRLAELQGSSEPILAATLAQSIHAGSNAGLLSAQFATSMSLCFTFIRRVVSLTPMSKIWKPWIFLAIG